MVTVSTMFVTVAEFSNIFSILIVLLCFCAMILFITRNMMVLRVHGDDLVFQSSLHQVPHSPRIPQMNMMKVHIPFTFKLLETSKSSYSEVQCSVSSQVGYCIQAYWGVSIRELHVCLWRPWASLRNACLEGNLLRGHYQQLGATACETAHGDRTVRLGLPRAALDLGTPPRMCYPLVIFLIRTDCQEDDVHPDETVALINVVHIKDTVCTLPTSILAQYLKQANGQLSCLKQLYLATGGAEMALAEPVANSSQASGVNEQLCVVCQYFPLSRALLPCRHTCICASCFDKLDTCPMCRGPIKSYFCIRSEEYMPPLQQNNKAHGTQANGPLHNWLDSWNDRLTDFLGFQR